MPLANFFKNNRTLRKDSGSHSRGTNPDPSGILSRPFEPLKMRAKSPSDLLDILGHPQFSQQVNHEHSSPKKTQVRPPPGPRRRASFHGISPVFENAPAAPQLKASVQHADPSISLSSPSPQVLLMPTPKMAVPPMEELLRKGHLDKTEVTPDEQEGNQEPHDDVLSFDDNSPCVYSQDSRPLSRDQGPPDAPTPLQLEELDELYRKLLLFQHHKERWAAREQQHLKKQEWMQKKLQETQAQLEQLQLQQSRPPSIQNSSPSLHPYEQPDSVGYSEHFDEHDSHSAGSQYEDTEASYSYYSHPHRAPPPWHRWPTFQKPIPRHQHPYYYYDDHDDHDTESLEDETDDIDYERHWDPPATSRRRTEWTPSMYSDYARDPEYPPLYMMPPPIPPPPPPPPVPPHHYYPPFAMPPPPMELHRAGPARRPRRLSEGSSWSVPNQSLRRSTSNSSRRRYSARPQYQHDSIGSRSSSRRMY